MQSTATSPEEYLENLPPDRIEAMSALRNAILKNLPDGFREEMSYGMLGYVIPHSIYPDGYHCNPELPLPFMSLASQKNFIAVYHMGIYADQSLMQWFLKEFATHSKTKPDMGKSCIRFKKTTNIPIELIGQLASKMPPQAWINMYEQLLKR